MHMLVMRVWHMTVGVGQCFMVVAMAVRTNRHRVMHMVVVPIVVVMRVFVV